MHRRRPSLLLLGFWLVWRRSLAFLFRLIRWGRFCSQQLEPSLAFHLLLVGQDLPRGGGFSSDIR